jgi:predicted Rossmann-fold nucleotide-binding protein
MSIIKRVCVYCGSSQGHDPRFVAAARRFGEILAANRIGLVYGCGSIGLIGTLEEVVEQLTWAQLGRHRKPILIANIAGYWDPLLVMFDHLLSLGFLTNGRLGHLVADNVDDILPTLVAAAAKVSEVEKLGEPERVERL